MHSLPTLSDYVPRPLSGALDDLGIAGKARAQQILDVDALPRKSWRK